MSIANMEMLESICEWDVVTPLKLLHGLDIFPTNAAPIVYSKPKMDFYKESLLEPWPSAWQYTILANLL